MTAGCYSIAPCGHCDGCRAIAAMPAWTPEETPPAELVPGGAR